MNTKILGNAGEALAVMHLKKQHYKILETNYTCHFGEIDIVAKKDDLVVFVEVKTRSSEKFGLPSEAVDKRKQQRIIKCAKMYISEHNLFDTQVRFDVIEVIDRTVNHIADAFRA